MEAKFTAVEPEDKPKISIFSCSCGKADRRFDYECTNCGDLFTENED